jgi:hypothetical protein
MFGTNQFSNTLKRKQAAVRQKATRQFLTICRRLIMLGLLNNKLSVSLEETFPL